MDNRYSFRYVSLGSKNRIGFFDNIQYSVSDSVSGIRESILMARKLIDKNERGYRPLNSSWCIKDLLTNFSEGLGREGYLELFRFGGSIG